MNIDMRTELGGKAATDAAPEAPTLDEALALLTYCRRGTSPVAPLAVVLANRETATDALLAAISVTPAGIAAIETEAPDGDHLYWLHIFAGHALALWQEARAFAPLVAYLEADSHMACEQLDDIVTEDLPAILARTYGGGDLALLKRLIEDSTAEPFVRDAALRSLHAMVLLGKLPRQELVAYGLDIAERLRTPSNRDFAELLVMSLADLGEAALVPSLAPWFDAGWIDRRVMRKSDLFRDESRRVRLVENSLLRPTVFADLADYFAGFPWFKNTDNAAGALAGSGAGHAPPYLPLDPYMRSGPKIGRNDPCPCGSGKKYKKCCLDADRT